MTIDFDQLQLIPALIGGGLMGLTSVAMQYTTGRVCGVSCIISNTVNLEEGMVWRLFFFAGLIICGLFFKMFDPISMEMEFTLPIGLVFLAGMCIGFGAIMGGGCTSGHMLTGLGNLRKRSFTAVSLFAIAGFISATLFYGILGYTVG